ncbi:hypothetical protein [Streptomyces sp. NPDC051554]|uniref:hypothetical protein n=1 Tax=Streptomyces sp. NPDC051554 TaxID=3365656 RepID=UPI0037B626EE
MPRAYNLQNPPPADFRRERARKAVAAAWSTDNLIRKLAERELTPEQRAALAALGQAGDPA